MATETLSNITQDEIEYARMTTLLKSELDWQSRETHARRSGIKEGCQYFLELLDQDLTKEEIKERLKIEMQV
jgi:hypothetical protein